MKKIIAFIMVLALMVTGSLAIAADKGNAREYNETQCSCC